MSTVIAASVLVPLSIAAVAFAVDKIEQGTAEQNEEREETKETEGEEDNDQHKGPGGLVDLSGGMLGIL